MTGTTTNGIRYPNNPNDYADLIKFFSEMASDVDKKFVPTNGANAVTSVLTSKTFKSTNGGTTQNSTVLQTGPTAASAFNIYDDNIRINGAAGRRLWIAGANNTDVAIRTKSDSDNLNRISMRAATVDITGAVTINGTLNITGLKTISVNYEADVNLAANATTWRLIYAPTTGFTFVAPPSGSVIIGYGGWVPTEATSVMLSYEILIGATIGSGTAYRPYKPAAYPDTQPPPQGIAANGTEAGSAQWVSCYNAYLHTGLTPGYTYNIRPWYRNANNTTLKLYRHYFIVQPDL